MARILTGVQSTGRPHLGNILGAILIMNKGVIVEQGTHNELLKKKSHYYDLYQNQFISKEES